MRRWVAGLVLTIAVVPAARAQDPGAAHSDIVSPPPRTSGVAISANGPSDNTAFSQDNRDVRLLAFDSAASNLIVGDTNGRRDVFVLRKARGAGKTGGTLMRASVSTSGRQANGDSGNPSVDGTTGWSPRCVAFESNGTNLDGGDRSTDVDVYLRDLRRKTTRLVSVAEVNARNPSIDGRCRYVAYEAGGRVFVRDLAARRTLRVGRGTRPDIQTDARGLVYERAGQIYYRTLRRRQRRRLPTAGIERLVSDSRLGMPGNGQSANPVVDDHGRYVAFQSTATDLCTDRCVFAQSPQHQPGWVDPSKVPSGDANGQMSDIYRRQLHVAPTDPLAMQLVTYEWNHEQANAPSYNPAITRAGQEVVFETAATNIGRPYPSTPDFFNTHNTTNVLGWYDSGVHRPQVFGISGWWRTEPGGWQIPDFNGSSTNPSISSRANYAAFTSTEYGHGGESNGPGTADTFLEWIGGSDHGLPTG